MLIMAVGFIISIVAGACVGIYSKNQMTATSVVMPVMMVFAFAPMLAMFNDKIEKVARFIFTQQLRTLLDKMTFDSFPLKPHGQCLPSSLVSSHFIF